MATNTHRDPRSIITPDAFEVAGHLVGTPLASPRRRAVAMLIDGFAIVLLTVATTNFSLLLGVVAAVFFMRAGFKRTEVRNSVFGRAMRFSVGCLGFLIAIVTVVLWSIFGLGFDASDELEQGLESGRIQTLATGALAELGLFDDLVLQGDREAVVTILDGAIRGARGLQLPEDEVRDLVVQLRTDSTASALDIPAIVDSIMAATPVEAEFAEAESNEAMDEEFADLSDAQALAALLELESAEPDDEEAQDRRAALQQRIAASLAEDTLRALGERVERLREDVEDAERARDDAQAEVNRLENRGLLSMVLNVLDELGFGFGWGALYLTIFLSWWNGQTVGKRMMGVRVVRLDGGPINWWIAFERAGGYAAGLFTGLLGFAQVWWDGNRQMIHDRIVGTVVVREGKAKVADWESAL